MNRREERFAWVVDVGHRRASAGPGDEAKRSVWDRIAGKDDDDDDDLPGPNAGATLWPFSRKDVAVFG